ncbi:MAG: alpha/beta fold hydrolase [Promethearchaeota archaeon]|nr:MAG: alpha/beta fold hydrolase [Candidatus Lokiarchaeota archaeon]
MEDLIIKEVDIPIKGDNITLKGSLYYSSHLSSKAPFIVILPGFLEHRKNNFVKFFTAKLASAGYYIVAYDYRAHGETKTNHGTRWNKIFPLIFSDIHKVLEWVLETQTNFLLEDKIALFGRSLGGAIVLSHGFINERAKKLIALSPRYDYHTTQIKFQEEVIKKISPHNFLKKAPQNNHRILIAHCKDDLRIPFENIFKYK